MQSFDEPLGYSTPYRLRPYASGEDTAALCQIYRDAVMQLGSPYYSIAQRRVWALWSQSPQLVDRMLSQGRTIVAEYDGATAGFAQLHPGSYVNMLYVAPGFARQGIGMALLETLEGIVREAALPMMQAHASLVSRNLFRKAGYRVRAYAPVTRHGVELPRHLMEKLLIE